MNNLLVNAFDFSYIFGNIGKNWYYYVIGAVVLTLVILTVVFKKFRGKLDSLSDTKRLVYIAVLSALATLSNVFDIKVSDDLQISLVATVGFISGYLLGAGGGFAVCFTGDLIGALINPHGVYNPVIAIGTGLWGFIPGVIFSILKNNKYVLTVISFFIGLIVISGGINTLGIWLMYGLGKKTFFAYYATFPFKAIGVVVNIVICVLLLSTPLFGILCKETERSKKEE